MPITSISRDLPNNVSIVRLTSTDTLADIAAPNYIFNQRLVINSLNKGTWQWFNSDVLLFDSSDGNAFFVFTDDTFSSLILLASSTDGTISPGLMDQIAYYALSGTVISGTNTLPALVQIHPVNVNNGLNASGTTFWAGDDLWKTVASSTNHSIYSVYVATDGSNITGNGSINAPYQTINFALSTILTASALTPFKIICEEGVYNETTISLKPFVNIDGQNSVLNVTGNIDADPSWSTGGNIIFGSFSEMNISGNFSLNLSISGSNLCIVRINDIEFTTIGLFTVIGGDNTLLILSALSSFVSALNISLENVNGAISQNFFANFDYLASSLTNSFNFQLLNSLSLGNVTYTTNVGALGVGSIIDNTKLFGTLSASGIVTLNIDVASLQTGSLPTLSGGAVVNYINVSNTLTANYSPANYIPDASGSTSPVTSVAAHLHGIDNALGGLATSNNYVYVSSTGSNVTGNGSFERPYATVAFAMGTILTATAANPFTISLIGGLISEPVQIQLKPFVSISGLNNSVILDLALNIVYDPLWDTTASPTCTLNNFSFITSNINLDATTFTNNTTALIFINDVIGIGRIVIFKGSSNFDPNLFGNNCLFQLQYSNSFVEFKSSILQNVTCNLGKSDAALRLATGFFLGNRLGTVVINSLGAGPATSANFFSNDITSLTGDGAVVSLLIDVVSYTTVLTIANSATYSLTSVSDGLDADYSPVNYIPAATLPTLSTSLQGHLRGIDNALSGSIHTWNDVTGVSQAASVKNGYVADNAGLVTITLPAIAPFGSIIAVQGKGAGGWSLVANAGQIINVGNTPTGVAGSASSTNQWDAIEVVCVTANTTWATRSMIGTLTVV